MRRARVRHLPREDVVAVAEVIVERIDTVVTELTDVVAELRVYILEQEKDKKNDR